MDNNKNRTLTKPTSTQGTTAAFVSSANTDRCQVVVFQSAKCPERLNNLFVASPKQIVMVTHYSEKPPNGPSLKQLQACLGACKGHFHEYPVCEVKGAICLSTFRWEHTGRNLVHSLDHSPAVLCCLPPLYGIHDKSGEGPPHPSNISPKSNFCQRTRGETLQKSHWDKISNIGVNVVADYTSVKIYLQSSIPGWC